MTTGQTTVRGGQSQVRWASGRPPGTAPVRAGERQRAKQDKIVAVAMEHFARHGYEGAKAEAIAAAAGVSKGAIFGYFGSKAGLFLAAYRSATRTFSRYLEAPDEVLSQGFFATVSYWLAHTPHMIHEDWIPYRVVLIGSYCSDLELKREITKYMQSEDPYGTRKFVEFGVERGEVRRDIEIELIVSLVDWLIDHCQDAIVTEELDPGLFGYFSQSAQLRERRVAQFVELLRSAISAPDGTISAPDGTISAPDRAKLAPEKELTA